MDPFTRRNILSFGAAGAVATVASVANAATFGNPDSPGQGAVNANADALRDPGPRNPNLASQFPDANNPPATDIGDLAQFWASFNNAHKRIQGGGWARQVTQADFPISTTFSGVNMRLGAGGIREMHWHLASEWAYMTNGQCRITELDQNGHAYVQDVEAGDLWFFPAGMPHSLQGIGTDGCEFLIAFDDGNASEFNTLLVTDWMAHTPPEILAKNFGQPVDAFKNIPLHNRWIYQSNASAPPLPNVEAQMAAAAGKPPNPFVFRLGDMQPTRETKSGSVRIADSTNFLVAKTVAASMVTIKPGGLREMHWHPNADEWLYILKGSGRATVFNTGPAAITANFHSGDIGYVKKALGHYLENTGGTDLVYMEVFRADRFEEISLSDWLAHSPLEMVAETLNLDPSVIKQFPKNRPDIMPA